MGGDNRQRAILVTSLAALATAAIVAAFAGSKCRGDGGGGDSRHGNVGKSRTKQIFHNAGTRSSSADTSGSVSKSPSKTQGKQIHTSICFLGNSITYFYDTPRFFQFLRTASGVFEMDQDSCLRGGATLSSLWEKGNGMQKHGFATERALVDDGSSATHDVGSPTIRHLLAGEEEGTHRQWDYVVINDYTQGPARASSRQESLDALLRDYVPLFLSSGATPVFLVTAAYRSPVKGSSDLGSVERFTSTLMQGYELYASELAKVLPPSQQPIVSPVGMAYLQVHEERRELWHKLFAEDDFHPSPHGSYLQCCVLHASIFGEVVPRDVAVPDSDEGVAALWDRARVRMMQPEGMKSLPLPNVDEAEYLWDVAGRVALGLIGQ